MRFPLLAISPDSAASFLFVSVIAFSLAGSLIAGALVWMAAAGRRGLGSMEPRWEELSQKLSRLLFSSAVVVIGFAGGLTGFSATLAHPGAASDILQIFFPALIVGGLGLILCVVFLGVHASGGKKWRNAPGRHWMAGVAAAVFLWVTAAVFISLRSFLLTGGSWRENHALWVAVLNPFAILDFLHWGFLSLAVSGAAGLFYAARQQDALWRRGLVRELGAWMARAAFAAAVFGLVWAAVVFWVTDAGVSFGLWVAVGFLLEAGLAKLVQIFAVRRVDRFGLRAAALFIVLGGLAIVASEASRRTVPSPFLIQGHMYRNGIRVSEVSLLNEAGYWKPVPWEPGQEAPAGALLGGYLFRGQCAVCHAGEKWESAKSRFRYADDVSAFLSELDRRHPALPVLAGTEEEREALAVYLQEKLGAAGFRPAPPPPPSPPKTTAPPVKKAPSPREKTAPPPEGAAPGKKTPEKPAAGGTPAPEGAPAEKPKAPEETPVGPPKEGAPPPAAAPAEEKKQSEGEEQPPVKPQAEKEKAPAPATPSGEPKPEPKAGGETGKAPPPPASPPAGTPPPSTQQALPPSSPAAPSLVEKKPRGDDFPVPGGNIVIIDPEKEKQEKKSGTPGAPGGAEKKAAPAGAKP
ncbi:MAG: hypothetical protein O2807_01715 [bacterium]|nr:hypothetical protein [bacterium]